MTKLVLALALAFATLSQPFRPPQGRTVKKTWDMAGPAASAAGVK